MQKLLSTTIFLFFVANIFSQKETLYHPQSDAATDITNAITKAKEKKRRRS